jgi:hypothetical protein
MKIMNYKILNAFLICFVFLFCKNGFAQDKPVNSIKINISDVKVATEPIKDSTFKYAVNRLANNKLEYYSKEFRNTRILPTFMHPFVAALHYGFAQHRPVVISPDMIWLMILQGFSDHVQIHYDSLQTSIVNFIGKKKIEIRRDEFILGSLKNDWQSGIQEIISKINMDLKTDIKPLLNNQFSTTMPKDAVAFQITIMKALNQYFEYSCMTSCGIPYIVLEGKPEDWKWIRDNITQFDKYGLGLWTKNLYPILDNIYESSKGNIDSKFWKSIYKWDSESGGNTVTGWIIRFFPYLGEESNKYLNPYLSTDIDSAQVRNKFSLWGLHGSSFGSGISSCDFEWDYFKTFYRMQFCGGFIGISQNKSDMSLRPEINWFIAHKYIPQKKEVDYTTYNTTDYSNWTFADRSFPRYETEEIEVYEPERDTLYYEICNNPDEMPIYKPEKNKTFAEGWEDFENDIKKRPKIYTIQDLESPDIRDSITMKLSVLVTSTGKCVAFKAIDDPHHIFYEVSSFLKDLPEWKPGRKKGEIVLTEFVIEI